MATDDAAERAAREIAEAVSGSYRPTLDWAIPEDRIAAIIRRYADRAVAEERERCVAILEEWERAKFPASLGPLKAAIREGK